MVESDLKPCPFCGNDGKPAHSQLVLQRSISPHADWKFVQCGACGSTGPKVFVVDAEKRSELYNQNAMILWNERAPTSSKYNDTRN